MELRRPGRTVRRTVAAGSIAVLPLSGPTRVSVSGPADAGDILLGSRFVPWRRRCIPRARKPWGRGRWSRWRRGEGTCDRLQTCWPCPMSGPPVPRAVLTPARQASRMEVHRGAVGRRTGLGPVGGRVGGRRRLSVGHFDGQSCREGNDRVVVGGPSGGGMACRLRLFIRLGRANRNEMDPATTQSVLQSPKFVLDDAMRALDHDRSSTIPGIKNNLTSFAGRFRVTEYGDPPRPKDGRPLGSCDRRRVCGSHRAVK